jgi:predicted RNA binding protein YcfA (HicA-like mRNA interferase family)
MRSHAVRDLLLQNGWKIRTVEPATLLLTHPTRRPGIITLYIEDLVIGPGTLRDIEEQSGLLFPE